MTLQDDSDFFSSQGSINSLEEEMVRKECLAAISSALPPRDQLPAQPQWPASSAAASSAAETGADTSGTPSMPVSLSILACLITWALPLCDRRALVR